jgi:hypothetical protein
MGYAVRTVCDRQTMNDFLRLPWRIYDRDPQWVPPILTEVKRTLDPHRNPYFVDASLQLFVCYDDDVAVARTMLVIKQSQEERSGVKTGFFGFFEAMDDVRAVQFLFAKVRKQCEMSNVRQLEGPFNPTHYSELGVLVDGFDSPPSFFQAYNPEYYAKLLEGAGFSRVESLFTGRNEHVHKALLKWRGRNVPNEVMGGYRLRHLDARMLDEELDIMRDVFNDAFSSNLHFLPVSKEEYRFSSRYLSLVTDPELIYLVEHHGKPVAVLMCVLDINPLLRRMNGKVGPFKYIRFCRERKKIRTLIVYAVGIKKAYQRTRLLFLLYGAMYSMASRFDRIECTWISEGNVLSARAATRLGMKANKRFAMYAMWIRTDDKISTSL